MGETSTNFARASHTAAETTEASISQAKNARRRNYYFAAWLALAALSTFAGFCAGRFRDGFTSGLKVHAAAGSQKTAPGPVATPQPGAKDDAIEEISRLAPQQQAERLLELAAQNPELAVGLIQQKLTSWREQLEENDRLFHLVLAALHSEDPRVRVAAVEIDLAANHLMKSPESIEKLRREIQGGSEKRDMALWRLGALGNRGVEPSVALGTLRHYVHDGNQEARFWAVEGLAMLGNAASIDALLGVLAHDPAMQVRERAANGLARSGLLTGEQRLSAVPQLLNLLDDDSLSAATHNLVGATLEAITGASFGKDAQAWRDWWAHHDKREKPQQGPKNLVTA
jgi:hypothetical protein